MIKQLQEKLLNKALKFQSIIYFSLMKLFILLIISRLLNNFNFINFQIILKLVEAKTPFFCKAIEVGVFLSKSFYKR